MSDSDDTKVCPYCAETIKAAAKICRFCGRDVSGPDVQLVEELEGTTVDELRNLIQEKGIQGAADHLNLRFIRLVEIAKKYGISTSRPIPTASTNPPRSTPSYSYAPPQRGSAQREGKSPWNIVGWLLVVVLILVIIGMAGC